MDFMKRSGQICHAKNLHISTQTIALLSKQTIKSIRPNSFAIEKTCFSTKKRRIAASPQVDNGSANLEISFSTA
jgi:hypothetical protein